MNRLWELKTYVPRKEWEKWKRLKKEKGWNNELIIEKAIELMKDCQSDKYDNETGAAQTIRSAKKELMYAFYKQAKRLKASQSKVLRDAMEDLLWENGML